MLQVTAPRTDAGVVALCCEAKDVDWGNPSEGTRHSVLLSGRRGGLERSACTDPHNRAEARNLQATACWNGA